MPNNAEIGLYQDIWNNFLKGDDKALSLIYYDFFDTLLNFGMKYSSDRFLVEDCIQNLFVGLLKSRAKQQPVNNLRFYLLKALKNQMLYEQRKTRKLKPLTDSEETEFRINYSIENTLLKDESEILKTKFLKMVNESLTDRQKEAIYLKFNCGFDYLQISELMNINIESVRTMIYRTLKSIKETFGTDRYSDLIFFNLFRVAR